MSDLLLRRRRAMMGSKVPSEEWTYILRADSTGRVPKAKIPVLSGQHIYMEWDYNETGEAITTNQYVFSLKSQVTAQEYIAMGLYSYPLIGIPWNKSIFKTGKFDAVMPKDVTVYIGCWTESEYTGTTNRGLYGQYIKIRIT